MLTGSTYFKTVVACAVLILANAAETFSQMPDEVKDKFLTVELRPEQVDAWRAHIEPTASELKWKKIPWLHSFSAGIEQGAKESKPILLWTMNGHPFGCT